VTPSITDSALKAAFAAIDSESATTTEKIEMLIEMAFLFQKKPKRPQELHDAVSLYQRAIDLCAEEQPLLLARALAGMGTALRAIPSQGADLLIEAKEAYEATLPILQEFASPEEVAEAQMNLGLVLQSLVAFNLARIADSIQAYQQALRVFTWQAYPQEYAILHNNIAIAYLSMTLSSDREDLRQALAVQSFEEALKWITLIDHPSEYAMLQNNLGNALQYLPSVHPVDNNLRAIAAYDEALKVRNAWDTPVEYANTVSNKANALYNLPDNPEHPEAGNRNNLLQAREYYQEAEEIFIDNGQMEQAQMVAQVLQEIELELQLLKVGNGE
jgi:tetratricopeptide (TPR) repeat protein